MTVREILLYPNDKTALRARSETVHIFNKKTRGLIEDLKMTLLAHENGIGLAAPQIGVHLRIVIVRLGARQEADDQAGPPIALINPQIVESGDEQKDFDGCLSFPGLYGYTIRPHYLRVRGISEDGKSFDRIFSGFDAVLAHHEMDHLDGVLFIDRIQSLDDLYRLSTDIHGKSVQVPVSEFISSTRLSDMPNWRLGKEE
jgi:peptide deformylase